MNRPLSHSFEASEKSRNVLNGTWRSCEIIGPHLVVIRHTSGGLEQGLLNLSSNNVLILRSTWYIFPYRRVVTSAALFKCPGRYRQMLEFASLYKKL